MLSTAYGDHSEIVPDDFTHIHYNSGETLRHIHNIGKYMNTFITDTPGIHFNSLGYCKTKDSNRFDEEINYTLDLKIPYGITKIKYKNNNYIYANYSQEQITIALAENTTRYETLVLSGVTLEILKEFLEDSRQYQVYTNKNNKILCRILQGTVWTVLNCINKRNANTLFLPFDIQETIFDKIQDFYDAETDYCENGMPFKLNWLLHGVAGSGKTSIINTIASKFDLDICFLPISKDLDDTSFIKAVTNIPVGNMLVIEDIDSLFEDRNSKYSLSFSTVLNVLDGVLKKYKLITLMTTNYKDRIDDALFRSGRIDYQLEFTHIKRNQVKTMFHHFFENQEKNLTELLEQTKKYKMSSSDIHRWCFQFRKSTNVIEHIDELIASITLQNASNEYMYM